MARSQRGRPVAFPGYLAETIKLAIILNHMPLDRTNGGGGLGGLPKSGPVQEYAFGVKLVAMVRMRAAVEPSADSGIEA